MHEEAYGRFLLLASPLSLYSVQGFLPSSKSYERDQLEQNGPEPGVLDRSPEAAPGGG